jgi:hypothetical protein
MTKKRSRRVLFSRKDWSLQSSATRKCIEDLNSIRRAKFLHKVFFKSEIPSILLPSLPCPTDGTGCQPGQVDVGNEDDDEMKSGENEEEEEEQKTNGIWNSRPPQPTLAIRRENTRRPACRFEKQKPLKLSLCSDVSRQSAISPEMLRPATGHAVPLA